MWEQCQHQVSDEVGGGLMSRKKEANTIRKQLLIVEHASCLFRGEQLAHEIELRGYALSFQHPGEILGHGADSAGCFQRILRSCSSTGKEERQIVRPLF